MSVDERAQAGLFLAMQYPVEVPGVSVANFLRTGQDRHRRRGAEAAHLGQGRQRRARHLTSTRPSPSARSTRVSPVARRSGTRSRSSPARPEGRDPRRDRLRPRHRRAQGRLRGREPVPPAGGKGVLLITHYTRILRYIQPDHVHVFVNRVAEPESRTPSAERMRKPHGGGLRCASGARPTRCRPTFHSRSPSLLRLAQHPPDHPRTDTTNWDSSPSWR